MHDQYCKQKRNWLYVAMTVLYVIYSAYPKIQLSIQAMSNMLVFVFILVCMLIEIQYKYVKLDSTIKYFLTMCVIGLGYQLLVSVRNTPYPFVSQIILLSSSFFPVALYVGIRRRNSINEMKITAVLIAALLVYIYVNTVIQAQTNSNIVHQMTKLNYTNSYLSVYVLNILTYDHSYATVPLCLLCLHAYKTRKGILRKIFSLLIFAFLIVAIFVAEYTSVLLILIICILVYIWRIAPKGSIVPVVLLFALPVVWVAFPVLLDVIIANIKSENMVARLTEVSDMMRYGNFGGYNMESRLNMYWSGIKAFFGSPIWGNSYLDVNPHSTFIQYASDLGLLGLCSYLYLIRKSKKIVCNTISRNSIAIVETSYLSMIITGIINPIIATPVLMTTVWLFVPLTSELLEM